MMNEEMQKEISKLKKEILELTRWKEEKEKQQLKFPLDIFSQDIVRDRLFVFADKSDSTVTADKSLGVIINGVKYRINVL
jgi:hypothetical protein